MSDYLQGLTTTTVSFTGRWNAEGLNWLLEQNKQPVEVKYSPGSAWFFPVYRGEAFCTDEGEGEFQLEFIGPPVRYFRNALAGPVYWLWSHIWLWLQLKITRR